MTWLFDTLLTPTALVLVVTALVAGGFGIWIGRSTVPAPAPPAPPKPGVTVHQLRRELNALVASNLAPSGSNQSSTQVMEPVADPAVALERDRLRDELEDATNDLHESAVSLESLKRRNEALSQAVNERDELIGHLGRQVVGDGWKP